MKFFTLILLVGLLIFFQVLGFSVFGVKPNLALATIIAISFFVANIWEGFLLVTLVALILKFTPGFAKEILVFTLLGIGAIFIKNYLPWQNFLSNLFLIAVATFIFYLSLTPKFILSAIFAKELFLNIIAGILVFALLSFLRQNIQSVR